MLNLAGFLSWFLVTLTTVSCSQREVLQARTSLPPQTAASPTRVANQSAESNAVMPMAPQGFDASQCGKQVTLTEIHSNPKRVKDRFGEFIELYNNSDLPVNLAGWRLSDGDRDSHVIASGSPLTVEPNAFVVLGASRDKGANGGIGVDYEYTNFRLSNQSDRVRLEDPCGTVVIDLSYPQPAGWPKLRAGRSVELSAAPSTKGTTRWRLATKRIRSGDWATPGTARWHRKRPKRSKTDNPRKKAQVIDGAPRGSPARPVGERPNDSKQTVRQTND